MNLFAKLFGSTSMPSLDAGQAQARLSEKPAPFVLDVRQPDEYRGGHIAGATLVPLHELPGRIKDLPTDRDIICVCASGSRSSSATRQLQAAGLNAINLQGGMYAWSRHGLPVKKGSGK
jgi:rhodanese-related sulfurtransferase